MSKQENQALADSDVSALPPGLHYDDNARPLSDPPPMLPPQPYRGDAILESDEPQPKELRALGSSLTIAPIGGQLISSVGGMVGFCPIGGNPAAIGTPNTTVETLTNYLDVMRWSADLTPAIDDVTQTTAWAQAIALTLPQGRFRLEIINDKRITPGMLAKYGLINPTLNGNVSLNLGCRMTLFHGNAANYPATSMVDGNPAVSPDYYYCPSVKLLNPATVIDAVRKEDGAEHAHGTGCQRPRLPHALRAAEFECLYRPFDGGLPGLLVRSVRHPTRSRHAHRHPCRPGL